VTRRATYLRWLTPGDARAVARVERAVYPRGARDGLRDIRFDLARASARGGNLSLGLFEGSFVVGYILAYVRRDRRAAFEEFEVLQDAAADLCGACVYVQDVVVPRQHGRQAGRLLKSWVREARRRFPNLPMDAFCRSAALEMWRRHEDLLAQAGFQFGGAQRVRDLHGDEEWHWLTWRPLEGQLGLPMPAGGGASARLSVTGLPPGYHARLVLTESQWAQLDPHWERLVGLQQEASPFMDPALQRCWWRHFGLTRNLLIVVLYRGGRVIGIAPLMVAPERHAGLHFDSLQFIGEHSLMERPDVLVEPSDPEARGLLWRAVAATRGRWDAALLYEQAEPAASHPFPRALAAGAFLVRETAAQAAPHAALDGGWPAYLAGRSAALRKNLARKQRRLREAGALELQLERGALDGEAVLARYLAVESRSWKHAAGQGIGSKPGHAAYYRDLCHVLGPRGGLRFAFLALDGQDIAASMSLVRRGRVAAAEVCHDEAFDRHSPGFVLTGLELEALFGEPGLDDFDFLSGTLENKLPWATGSRESRDVYVLPAGARGRAALAWMFSAKPAAKRLLGALGLRKAVFSAVERWKLRSGGTDAT
jgi:CelD/BcsL family acetyltransferase involved in cellulose biosynthesis